MEHIGTVPVVEGKDKDAPGPADLGVEATGNITVVPAPAVDGRMP